MEVRFVARPELFLELMGMLFRCCLHQGYLSARKPDRLIAKQVHFCDQRVLFKRKKLAPLNAIEIVVGDRTGSS